MTDLSPVYTKCRTPSPLDALKGNDHEPLATDYPQRSVIESSV
jgi:hypothetical protein